jgi:hypothetical protein
MKRILPLTALVILLAACDQIRLDNRLDPVGSGFRPLSIQVKAMPNDQRYRRAYPAPDQYVLPHSGAQDEGVVGFEAGGGMTSRFRFWKGPGIEGDTQPKLQVKIQDGAVYEAWFAPTWMDQGTHIAIEDGQVIPCGDSWCSVLSVNLYAQSRQRIPLRPWRVLRSSAQARIEPLDSDGGNLRSLIDTSKSDPGAKFVNVRLLPNGGNSCIGMELGRDGVGLDLRDVEIVSANITGNGAVKLVWTLGTDAGTQWATQMIDLTTTQSSYPTAAAVFSSAAGPLSGVAWASQASRALSFDICTSGSDTANVSIANIDLIGASFRKLELAAEGQP